MPNAFQKSLTILRPIAVWLLGLVAVVVVGGSLMTDMTGESAADAYVLARWSVEGLRVYLWLEAGLLAAIVAALGIHVVASGFAIKRGRQSHIFGIPLALHPRMPRQMGYVFVLLGAALVALSLTTLVMLNSCVYMRLV
jgi:hypothetical protein